MRKFHDIRFSGNLGHRFEGPQITIYRVISICGSMMRFLSLGKLPAYEAFEPYRGV